MHQHGQRTAVGANDVVLAGEFRRLVARRSQRLSPAHGQDPDGRVIEGVEVDQAQAGRWRGPR